MAQRYLQQCNVDVSLSGVTSSGRGWIEEGAGTEAMLGLWVREDRARHKLQALVYDSFLQPVTGIVDYAIGLEKLSANEQFFVGAQMTVTL